MKQEIIESENTFQAVVDEFFASRKKIWSESNYEKNYSALRRDILLVFAGTPIKEITKQGLLSVIKKIEARGVTRASRDTFNLCGQIWRYAVTHDKAPHNITADVDKKSALQPHKTTHFRTITDIKRVGQLLHAIDGYSGSYIVKCAIRLAPMLFLRPSELGGLMWDEVNLENAELRIKAERMKMRQLHIVPLASQAIEILGVMKKMGG
jgi:integrase